MIRALHFQMTGRSTACSYQGLLDIERFARQGASSFTYNTNVLNTGEMASQAKSRRQSLHNFLVILNAQDILLLPLG